MAGTGQEVLLGHDSWWRCITIQQVRARVPRVPCHCWTTSPPDRIIGVWRVAECIVGVSDWQQLCVIDQAERVHLGEGYSRLWAQCVWLIIKLNVVPMAADRFGTSRCLRGGGWTVGGVCQGTCPPSRSSRPGVRQHTCS